MKDESLTLFLEKSPLFLALVDQNHCVTACSDAWKVMFDAGEGRAINELFYDQSRESVSKNLADVFGTQTYIQELPVTVANRDNSEGLLSIWPISTTNEAAVLSFTLSSAFAKTKMDLDKLQQLHELILNAAGEGIYGLDNQGRMTFANQASTEIIGWSVDESLGQVAHAVHHHSHADGSKYDRVDCPIYAAFKDGKVHRVDDEVFWHADGRAIPVEYTSTPIVENDQLMGAVVVFRDISERVKIEKQREAAFQEIKQLKEQLELERDYLRDEIKITSNFGEIIGQSQPLRRMLEQIEAVAQTNANVLVLGESGVGKELVARAIHKNSDRAEKPLVKVNCASIPAELFESEFFGHVKGAFTSAHKDRVGRLQLADGGTLFLDEVGEIPMALQSKLLRALQEQEFERVGDEKTISVDVRVVAATNRDLHVEIAAGRFREDLYYRLSVFPIEVPTLRERKEDVIPITQHLLKQICDSMGKEVPALSNRQGEFLMEQNWPGNIRELRNVLERAVILTRGSRLRLDLAMPGEVSIPEESDSGEERSDQPAFLTDAEFQKKEKANIVAALEYAGWKISGKDGAAAQLGIKPSTLTYRMKKHQIDAPRLDPFRNIFALQVEKNRRLLKAPPVVFDTAICCLLQKHSVCLRMLFAILRLHHRSQRRRWQCNENSPLQPSTNHRQVF